jgi:hypothetical protein
MIGLKASALAAALLVAASAAAAPLAYDEGVSGDLAPFPVTSLSLDTGVNTVTGSLSFSGGAGLSDFDGFLFALPTGGQVDSISFEFELSHRGATFASLTKTLAGSPQNVNLLGASPVALFASQLPLSDSPFAIEVGTHEGDVAWQAAYTLTVVVSGPTQVPEAGTFALLLGGCAGLMLSRRRKANGGTVEA